MHHCVKRETCGTLDTSLCQERETCGGLYASLCQERETCGGLDASLCQERDLWYIRYIIVSRERLVAH